MSDPCPPTSQRSPHSHADHGERGVSLASVLCTEELHRRAGRPPDYATENRVLGVLAQALADSPHTILQTLTDTILEILGVGSAGVSLLTADRQRFVWPAIAGAWRPHLGEGTPRDFGPCGDVLDHHTPLLFRRPERRYAYLMPVTPVCEECLLVPFYVAGKAVGTIWAATHDESRPFDAEDLRQLESVGRFASAAYQATQSLDAALEQRHVTQRLVESAGQSSQAIEKFALDLRASEERYRALFESMDEGFCILEKVEHPADEPLDFRYVEANPAFAVQSGLSGVVGRTLRQARPPEFEQWLPTFEAILRTGEPIRFERALANGRVLEQHAFRVADDGHRRIGVSCTDITERKRAAQVLRTSEEGRQLALDSAELGTFNIHAATSELATDARFRAIFGFVGARMTYEQAFAIVHPDDRAQQRDEVAAALRPDNPVPYATEYRIVHPDGTVRWVFAKARVNFVQEGSVWKLESFDGTVVDITERKQAEEALRESEAFNRSIIDSSRDCIKVLDLDGTLLSVQNGQATPDSEDLRSHVNSSWVALWNDGDRMAAHAAVAAAAAGGAGNFVGSFPALFGQLKWWDVTISPILDAEGKPARLLAVSRDITVRYRAELNLALLASVSQDLAHLTSVNDMMRTVGAKIGDYLNLSLCAFVEVNEAADEVVIFHDWHRDDVPGLTGVYRLADFVEEAFIRTARTGDIIVVRNTATDPRTTPDKFAALEIAAFICVPLIEDGQWRFALCLYHSAPCDWRQDEIDLSGELAARIWTQLQQLRNEDALRRSEERYRYLFNSIDEGFCILELIFDDNDKAVDYRYLEVNPAFEKQTGIAEAKGKCFREFAPGHEPEGIESYSNVLSAGKPVRFVNESKISKRWFDVYAFKVGRPEDRKVAVIVNNITERMLADEALRHSVEALADLDRRKDEFLAMLSHELRSPLAPISNAVQLLRLHKNEDPLQHQARTIIERQVGQLKHLVDDLLEVSRITTGRVHLRQERLDLRGIVERAMETARPVIEQRQHEVTLALPSEPTWLYADAARMEQVAVNLLTNAAKYTDAGGHIWLTVQQEGDAAVLRVRDTGTGIAPELLPRIFDLFTQADRSLDRAQGGLGIGLSLVQRLVDLHGGTVEVSSVFGKGSEFVVRLPVMQAPLPPPPATAEAAALPGTHCRVLVVDDSVDAARLWVMLLEEAGHEVRMAHDGPTALQAAIEYRPDAVLMDIGLPRLNGFEVAKRIRQQSTLEHVVLIAITGYGHDTDRQRSQDAGFDHHLVKPADFGKVQDILAAVSERATP